MELTLNKQNVRSKGLTIKKYPRTYEISYRKEVIGYGSSLLKEIRRAGMFAGKTCTVYAVDPSCCYHTFLTLISSRLNRKKQFSMMLTYCLEFRV